MKTFESLRSEKEFDNIWMKIIEFSDNNNLSHIISGKKKVSIINKLNWIIIRNYYLI